MVGFLCTTLGNGVRPRSGVSAPSRKRRVTISTVCFFDDSQNTEIYRGYAYVFQLCTLALAILMALEFLVQQYARQRYSQFHLKDSFFSSIAQ